MDGGPLRLGTGALGAAFLALGRIGDAAGVAQGSMGKVLGRLLTLTGIDVATLVLLPLSLLLLGGINAALGICLVSQVGRVSRADRQS